MKKADLNELPATGYRRRENYLLFGITAFYLLILVLAFVDRLLLFYLISGNEYFNPIDLPRKINLIPFATIRRTRFLSMAVLGNILAFLPIGIFLKLYVPSVKRSLRTWMCFLIPAGIELTQYLLATGSLDIDDYVLNVCGILSGFLLYNAVFTACKGSAAAVKTLVVNTALIFPPFLISFIRCLLSDKRDAHLKLIDLAVHFVYLAAVFLCIKGAAKWQYAFIAFATAGFGIFFYAVFLRWV